ncbi:hypothetical protein Ahy_A07g036111 [Arachis hypogaea]|uniref:40S ribosomal protein SA n=1 Tax=Arachis hypogaea TaxID=3818 RepID=A0A445CFA0_ARAHY|nr:hypothetical protein Ahy_A07g036111 [Arachis hypogaea]
MLSVVVYVVSQLTPIEEGALGNIPTIAFCDTDSSMRYVDVGIPANNKGKHSIGCLFWLLARMVLQMRGTIRPGLKWDVMIYVFPSVCIANVSSPTGDWEPVPAPQASVPAPCWALKHFGLLRVKSVLGAGRPVLKNLVELGAIYRSWAPPHLCFLSGMKAPWLEVWELGANLWSYAPDLGSQLGAGLSLFELGATKLESYILENQEYFKN